MSDAPHVKVRDDGRVEYRASSLGGCDMALLAARLGFEAVPVKSDAPIMKVFQAGLRIEDEVLAKMPRVGLRQAEVKLAVTGRISVVGHIDGLDTHDQSIVEVKSQNRDSWDEFGRKHWDAGIFPKYRWQVSSYMHAFDCQYPLKLIRILRDDDGNEMDRAESYVDEPFYSVGDIRSRILRVEAAAATGVLNATCTPSFPCPYFYLHEEIDRELIDDESIDVLAQEYEDARAAESTAAGRKQAAKRALREALEDDKYTTAGDVRITFYTVNRKSLDRELLNGFLKLHKRDIDDYTLSRPSESLRITLPKEKDVDDG